ncbi:hypothetical protein GCM10010383_77030 [Streptomyces lomondensis]|uniref:Uncharacterized protein n=1 Tax=Streptomyces lomondensis TaxID=68229 RepID=A0ABQ2XWV4_9ACTN|nr:hypothetical protein GCM10010383_77030 [Streptomyces lomondensis]
MLVRPGVLDEELPGVAVGVEHGGRDTGGRPERCEVRRGLARRLRRGFRGGRWGQRAEPAVEPVDGTADAGEFFPGDGPDLGESCGDGGGGGVLPELADGVLLVRDLLFDYREVGCDRGSTPRPS